MSMNKKNSLLYLWEGTTLCRGFEYEHRFGCLYQRHCLHGVFPSQPIFRRRHSEQAFVVVIREELARRERGVTPAASSTEGVEGGALLKAKNMVKSQKHVDCAWSLEGRFGISSILVPPGSWLAGIS